MVKSINRLYELMQNMLTATGQDNNSEINRINRDEFTQLFNRLYDVDETISPLLKKYDNCRNVCCCAVGIFHNEYRTWFY